MKLTFFTAYFQTNQYGDRVCEETYTRGKSILAFTIYVQYSLFLISAFWFLVGNSIKQASYSTERLHLHGNPFLPSSSRQIVLPQVSFPYLLIISFMISSLILDRYNLFDLLSIRNFISKENIYYYY